MIPHLFSFVVNEKNYTAKFIIKDNAYPQQLHVYDIFPPDYLPEQPYIFLINQESKELNFPLKDPATIKYDVPISKALVAKFAEMGVPLFDANYHSGHEHDNSI